MSEEVEVGMGDYVVLTKGNTVVTGVISGFLMEDGDVRYVFVDNIKNSFSLAEWHIHGTEGFTDAL